MQYRDHRGERLPEIGVGCYALSGVYGAKDPAHFVGLLRRAHDLGVTFFDTADIYGPAEEVLGRAVAPFRRQVWIASKVGARAGLKTDCSPEHVRASCEQSLRRLQTDVIDLYQIHFNDPQTSVEETVGVLKELQTAGKIRYYGVGHLPMPRLQSFVAAGEVFSALVELSAVARGARAQVLPLCQVHQVAGIAFSVTGRGLLSGCIEPGHVFDEGDLRRVDPLFQRDRFASGLRVAKRLRGLGGRYGKTPAQMAIAWVLAQPGVTMALTGPSTRPHLEENLAASGWSIAPEDLAELEHFFQQEDERLRREEIQTISTILQGELAPQSALTDLVYVLETLMDLELATEEVVVPVFQKLWPLRKQAADAALPQLQTIQLELRAQFLSTLRQEGPA